MPSVTLMNGDCLELLKTLPDESIDSVVTDPPYGISFMNAGWDHQVPGVDVWRECLRVLKPGGHLLSFAGTRTQHRMASAIEDAGFEIRDVIMWVYGSGFPKSHNVSKAIDKAAPATEAAKQWDGWGSALKPAVEPITLAQKPFRSTIAANVLKHGVGALNIDGCRVPNPDYDPTDIQRQNSNRATWEGGVNSGFAANHTQAKYEEKGRWPANIITDGSDEVRALFPQSNGGHRPKARGKGELSTSGHAGQDGIDETHYGNGSAARFFYCAKASKADRDEGLEGFEAKKAYEGVHDNPSRMLRPGDRKDADETQTRKNIHPTVKPTDLMAYLCRLVTPPGGTVLDPFMGSGSTGKAAVREGFDFVGMEMSKEFFEIAKARVRT